MTLTYQQVVEFCQQYDNMEKSGSLFILLPDLKKRIDKMKPLALSIENDIKSLKLEFFVLDDKGNVKQEKRLVFGEKQPRMFPVLIDGKNMDDYLGRVNIILNNSIKFDFDTP